MTADPPLLEAVAARAERMRPSERKVAAALLRDPTGALGMSMAGLAAAAGVSEPTVMRFCTGLGFAGFRSFTLGLAQALAVGLPVTHSAIGPDDPVDAVAAKIFDHTLSSLDRARRALNAAAVAAAVDALLRAGRLLFVGLGASGLIAQDALHKAMLFGVPCAAPTDVHQQYMAAAMATADTVVVAVSHTGRTAPVLEVAARARVNGAVVVAITGAPGPLAELADVALVVRTFEDTDIHTPTVSRLAGLVVIDVLATSVAVRRGPEHLERLRAMKDDLASFRGGG
ncbi:SIS domain-containing protein [Pseudonocardia nigra]|uniref:SIS domain-containing protein n=1 Tax=Pseudonocardia nigra TaxID=1921578 RepID=UPI001C5DF5B9|nr:SIS domain-containing protein [Pseudonocardia nigra]